MMHGCRLAYLLFDAYQSVFNIAFSVEVLTTPLFVAAQRSPGWAGESDS